MRQSILYLITSSGRGGAERYVATLAAAANERYDVSVMGGASERRDLYQALPDRVHRLTATRLKRRIAPLSDLLAVLEVRRTIDDIGIDLVHCNSTKAGLVGALAARLSKRRPKVVYTAHGWAFAERRGIVFRLLTLWSESLSARFRDATVTLSEKETSMAERLGLAGRETLRLIPHGIDPEEVELLPKDAARERLAREDGQPLPPFVFGTVANAYPAKALPLLIEAFEAAAEDRTDAALVVIGEGPESSKLEAKRNASPAADRIHLTGSIGSASRLLRGFDVFVLSSTKEGMPWALLEAALASLPIVATKVGAVEEMFEDGTEALLVPPGDADALANAMRRAMDDARLRDRLSKGSRRVAERYSRDAMVRRTLDLYGELLADR